ncbi:MAG: hypothetical protein DCC71_22545, partial [Proteobacteria bacterium]
AGAGALALGVGAHWLVPAVAEADRVSIATIAAGSPGARYADFAPAPGALLERRSVDVFAGSLPRALRAPGAVEMPYYAGVGLLVAAWAGARGARRRPGDLFAASLLAAGLLLCVEPLARAWGSVESLARMQFPWRHLLVATPAAAWLAGAAIAGVAERGRSSRALAALAGLLLLADAAPYLGVPVMAAAPEALRFDAAAPPPAPGLHAPLVAGGAPIRCERLLLPPADRRLTVWRASPAYPEYMTPELLVAYRIDEGDRRSARAAGVACEAEADGIRWLDAAPLLRVQGGAALGIARFADAGDLQRFELAAPVHGRVQLLESFFPGFRARSAEGRAIELARCDGWICLDVREPTAAIELVFGATPARSAGALLSALSALALLGAGLAARRRA